MKITKKLSFERYEVKFRSGFVAVIDVDTMLIPLIHVEDFVVRQAVNIADGIA